MIFLSVGKEYNTMKYTQKHMTNSYLIVVLNRNWRNPKIVEKNKKYTFLLIFEKSHISRHFIKKFKRLTLFKISWAIKRLRDFQFIIENGWDKWQCSLSNFLKKWYLLVVRYDLPPFKTYLTTYLSHICSQNSCKIENKKNFIEQQFWVKITRVSL